jgi:hypothetical protein
MTVTSIKSLQNFLNNHQPFLRDDMRVADYGGTEAIGANFVQQLLETGGLKDYHMLDFDNGVDLRKPIKGKKFDLGICMDLLEHTSNPFIVAENIIGSLKSGAYLFVTVPWSWNIHHHPDDYWRFSPSGLGELFKEMEVEAIFQEVDDYKSERGATPSVIQIAVPQPWIRSTGYFKKK